MIVRTSFLNSVARLDHGNRLNKLCLILAQYLCDKRKYEKHGTMFIASAVKETVCTNMLSDEDAKGDTALKFERFTQDIMRHYEVEKNMADPGLAGTYIKAKAALYARTGKLLSETYSSSPPPIATVAGLPSQFGAIEAKFIMKLRASLPELEIAKLPTPLQDAAAKNLAELEEEEEKKKKPEEKNGPTVQPIVLSRPVSWSDGEVEKTVDYEAEVLGFSVGGHVALKKKSKIGPEGRKGIIKAFSKIKSDLYADVEWDEVEDDDNFPSEARFVLSLVRMYCTGTHLDRQASPRPIRHRTYTSDAVRTYVRLLVRCTIRGSREAGEREGIRGGPQSEEGQNKP